MNGKKSWSEIEEALQNAPKATPTPSDAFWEDFRARARLHPQQQPEANWARGRLLWSGLGATAAAALLLVAAARFMPPAEQPGFSEINSVEVVASHGGVLIMEDADSESTILWIVDMELEGGTTENHS